MRRRRLAPALLSALLLAGALGASAPLTAQPREQPLPLQDAPTTRPPKRPLPEPRATPTPPQDAAPGLLWTLTLTQLQRQAPPRMSLTRVAQGQPLKLTVRQASKRAERELTTVTLPAWVDPARYRFEVTTQRISDTQRVVLFEALPMGDKSSPGGSFTAQVAWLIEADARRPWTFIARVSYSELDGGELLELRPSDAKGQWTLFRQRAMPNLRFCGVNQDASMDLERFVPAQATFVLEQDLTALLEGASVLQAYLPARTFEPGPLSSALFFWQQATSDLRNPANTTSTVIRPLALGDRRLETAWSTGESGLGLGEFATAKVESALPLKGFRIFPGQGSSAQAHADHPAPTRLLVGLSDGTRYVVEVPSFSYDELAQREGLIVELAKPHATECLSVMILAARTATTPAPKRRAYKLQRAYDDAMREHTATSIAEITPLFITHGQDSRAAAAILLNLYMEQPDAARRQRLAFIGRQHTSALAQLVRDRIAQSTDDKERERLVGLLAQLPGESSTRLLITLFQGAETSTPEYRAIKRALFSQQHTSAPEMLRILDTLPAEETRRRADVIRLLGRVGRPEDLTGLLDQLGKSDDAMMRQELVRAIAAGGEPMVQPLIAIAVADADTLRGVDALRALDAITRARFQDERLEDAQQDALISLTAKPYSPAFTLRVIHTLGALKLERALPRLRQLAQDPARSPMVRRQAILALGQLSTSQASLDALIEALSDEAPDVRIAAIDGLANHKLRARATAEVIDYVRRERWRRGLDPALAFLAHQQAPGLQEKLESLLADQDRPKRQLAVARALRQARRGVSAQTVAPLLFAPVTGAMLRRQLIALLSFEQSPQGRDLLWRAAEPEAFSQLVEPLRAQDLRQAALLAIGYRQHPDDMARLAQVVRTDADPKIQENALRALSFYRTSRVMPLLDTLEPALGPERRETLKETREMVQRRLDINSARQKLDDPFGKDDGEQDDD